MDRLQREEIFSVPWRHTVGDSALTSASQLLLVISWAEEPPRALHRPRPRGGEERGRAPGLPTAAGTPLASGWTDIEARVPTPVPAPVKGKRQQQRPVGRYGAAGAAGWL